MRFFAYHGIRQGEADAGQRFEVDVELSGSLRNAGRSDNLKDTFDYDRIYALTAEAVTQSRRNLIEALAEDICARLLEAYPMARVRVVIRKPGTAVKGVLDCAEVELVREDARKRSRSK